jgi:hypothetical protein
MPTKNKIGHQHQQTTTQQQHKGAQGTNTKGRTQETTAALMSTTETTKRML